MKSIAIYLFTFMYLANNCYAGNENYLLGARAVGMAASSVALTDIWASVNNQAGLGYMEKTAAALYYENRLNVKSLALQAGAVVIPVKSTVLGVNYHYFGFSPYNELKLGIAAGKKLGEKLALGVQIDYFHTHIAGDDYGNTGILCGEVGLIYELVKHLTVGVHIFNISQSIQLTGMDEHIRIPTIMRFGVGYTINGKAVITAETEKESGMDATFKGGLEYSLVDRLSLRCGVSTGYMYQYAFGLGYGWKRFTVDMACCHHKFLGYSPHVSLIAELGAVQ